MEHTRNLKLFYDFEFIEGTQRKYVFGIPLWKTKPTIEMISLGMVTDNGNHTKQLYYINKDFNIDDAWNRYDGYHEIPAGYVSDPHYIPEKNYWIRNNILKPIWEEMEYRDFNETFKHLSLSFVEFKKELRKKNTFTKRRFKKLISKYGIPKEEIRKDILKRTEDYKSVSTYGYFCDYDHVLLSWIFGKMIDLPNNFNKFSYDMKQYQDDFLKEFAKKNVYLSVGKIQLYLSDVLKYVKQHTDYPKKDIDNPHHAKYDAIWIAKLYTFLKRQGLKM